MERRHEVMEPKLSFAKTSISRGDFMINTLQLNEFKGIESIAFDGLGRVNLIVGGNNTGKTSVLEALTLLFGNQQHVSELPKTFRQKTQRDDWKSFWPLLARKDKFASFSLISDLVEIAVKLNDDAPCLYRIYGPINANYQYPMIVLQSDTQGFINCKKNQSFRRNCLFSPPASRTPW